jgi:hypothetical protein
MQTVKIGSRVAYKENLEDLGTIVDIVLDASPFVVRWDNDLSEERVDQFMGSQLIFVSY